MVQSVENGNVSIISWALLSSFLALIRTPIMHCLSNFSKIGQWCY